MTRIELPIKAITVENENLGIDEFEDAMAYLTVEHIVFVTAQPDGTAMISMLDGTDITTSKSYIEVKAMLEQPPVMTGQGKPVSITKSY